MIKIVRGNPTPEELAAALAVVQARGGGPPGPGAPGGAGGRGDRPRRGRSHGHRSRSPPH
ncbi:acyl-CoA carboxylase epsilon subunit, partial [Streptomyces sp. NPDC059590]|uniref:acyl-CoA carboxylase epsilon subunit n=1 Tax=Streptomyces sp. NPDC059590 TaxID=3346877 RepID=UPI0036B75E32